jgi:cyclophilin family peptidyl-prolyl cis-trans isomerase
VRTGGGVLRRAALVTAARWGTIARSMVRRTSSVAVVAIVFAARSSAPLEMRMRTRRMTRTWRGAGAGVPWYALSLAALIGACSAPASNEMPDGGMDAAVNADVASTGALSLSVTSVRQSPTIGATPPSSGMSFFIADVALTNTSVPAAVSAGYPFFSAEFASHIVITASANSGMLDTPCRTDLSVMPGGTVRCQVAFELATAELPQTLRYDDHQGHTASAPIAAGPMTPYVPDGYTLSPFLSDQPQRSFTTVPAPGTGAEPGRDYLAVIETDVGRVVIDLYEDQTPIAVNSFVWLARHHYFDGIAFHRVVPNFVAQGGDPNTLGENRATWGQGGPGYHFGTEPVSTLNYDAAGVVGMARTNDPQSNGSQFFITYGAQPSLNQQYTIFARVTQGLDVTRQFAVNGPMSAPPAMPTRMVRVYAVERMR